LKLSDFNTARSIAEEDALTCTGDVDYASPEVLVDGSATCASDIWSAGLCAYLMLAGRLPRYSSKFVSKHVFADAVVGKPVVLDVPALLHVSIAGKQLMEHCLQLDAVQRWDATEVLACEWLQVSGENPGHRQVA